MEFAIKIYVGSDKPGQRFNDAIRKEAEKHFKGSVSKLLLDAFCIRYGYDPTGKPIKPIKK